jgi:hypothetical protein
MSLGDGLDRKFNAVLMLYHTTQGVQRAVWRQTGRDEAMLCLGSVLGRSKWKDEETRRTAGRVPVCPQEEVKWVEGACHPARKSAREQSDSPQLQQTPPNDNPPAHLQSNPLSATPKSAKMKVSSILAAVLPLSMAAVIPRDATVDSSVSLNSTRALDALAHLKALIQEGAYSASLGAKEHFLTRLQASWTSLRVSTAPSAPLRRARVSTAACLA